MPRPTFGTLGDLDANGSGTEVRVQQLEELAVLVAGDQDGVVDIEVRFTTDQDWESVKQFSAGTGGVYEPQFPIFEVRATLSSNSTGTAKVRYSGRDHDKAG